jgi:hypothetical protein
MWQQWALFPVGIIIGVLFGLAWANEKITRLRVALGDFLRAETEHKMATTGAGDMRTGRALDEARDRALEVLEL